MKAIDVPANFPIPFANSAGGAYIRNIPEASQIGITPGRASLTDGFPPLNFENVQSGGTPPAGKDFNGILNQITADIRWMEAGGWKSYDPVFSAAIGGYPNGAIVASVTSTNFWKSTIDDNTSDPDTGGGGWITFGGGGGGGGSTTPLYNYFVAAAGQTLFNLSYSYLTGFNSLQVYRNGAYIPGVNFTETSNTSITLSSACALNDEVVIVNLPGSSNSSTIVTTNLAGGIANNIPYQTAPGTTQYIPPGTLGQILTAGVSGLPGWAAPAYVGTVTAVSVASAHGFAGTSSGGTTPALTLTTTITGVLKGDGTSLSAAVNSDLPAMTATVGGAVPTPPNDNTKFLSGIGTWIALAGSGTVTTVSVVNTNGFSGTVANASSTPAITINTTVNGIVKGNGSAISAATAGLDYSAGTSALVTGILKSTTGTGGLTIAVAADFPTLNQNTSGNAATVTTNANLTGVITSVGNATSIASQTGTGTKFVVDTNPALIGPDIGTPTAGVLTNCSGTAASLTAGAATNLAGGIANKIPYQTAAGVTAFIAAGTSGQVLTADVSGVPGWVTPGTGGTVTTISVASANGFAGTVATATTTPVITITTSITGILSGNGTAISAATTTGSGSVVLGTGPTLSAPLLGTPASGVLTNCTGTASGLTAGGNALLAGSGTQAFAMTTAAQGTNTTQGASTAFAINEFGKHNSRVINGYGLIQQRPAPTLTAALQYGAADRQLVGVTGGTGISGTVGVLANTGFKSGIGFGAIAASWTTGAFIHKHRIIASNCVGLDGQSVTISGKLYQDTGGSRSFTVSIGRPTTTIDVFSAITNIGTSSAIPVVSGTVTAFSFTQVLGATDADKGLEILITDNATNTVVSKNYLVGDLKLEEGTVATQDNFIFIEHEKSACLPYCQPLPTASTSVGLGVLQSSTLMQGYFPLPVAMRGPFTWSNPPTAWVTGTPATGQAAAFNESTGTGAVITGAFSTAVISSATLMQIQFIAATSFTGTNGDVMFFRLGDVPLLTAEV